MRKLLFIAMLLMPLAAHADDDIVVLPAALVSQMASILGKAPWDQIDATMSALRACVAVQAAKNGVTVSHGECSTVTQWLGQHPFAAPVKKEAP